MNNKWLVSFITVAQTGSVTSAAKELFISPQALLQQINLLEEEVGTKLLQRGRVGVSLTFAGEEFLKGARKMLEIYSKTLNRCQLVSKAESTIRIPISNNVVIPKLMEQTSIEYTRQTGKPVEFIANDHYEDWFNGLLNLQYDVVEHFALDGRCPGGIHFEYLDDHSTWLIMSEYHPLARHSVLTLDDLEGCHMIMQVKSDILFSYSKMYLECSGINVQIDTVENDRFQVIEHLNNGAIYMGNKDIALAFAGYKGIPLDFDTHIQHGFACRKEMYESCKPFFDIAHRILESK